MLKNYRNKPMAILVALCLCLSLMPVITPIHAHADGTDGVTVTKVASESDLTVGSLYAFTPTWQSDSTMTPYGRYENGLTDSGVSGYNLKSVGSGVKITNVGKYRGKQVNMKINIDSRTKSTNQWVLDNITYDFLVAKNFGDGEGLAFGTGLYDATLTFSFYYNDGTACSDLYFHMLVWSIVPGETYTFYNTNMKTLKYYYADYSIESNVRTLSGKGNFD